MSIIVGRLVVGYGMVDWREPWFEASDRDRDALETQLRKEVGTDHVLTSANVHLLARRFDQDDALFLLGDGRLAEVHLTWKSTPETDPQWPATKLYTSIEEWLELSGNPAFAEFSE